MAKERPFSKQELADLQRKLSTMSMTGITDFYAAAYWRCQIKEGKPPEARHIQELVQAWKEIRKWTK